MRRNEHTKKKGKLKAKGEFMRFRKIAMMSGLALAAVACVGCGAGNKTEQKKEQKVTEKKENTKEVASTLKDAFADYFKVGVAVNPWQLTDETQSKVITDNFNSITMENQMKPESLLDWEGSENSEDGMPAIKEDVLDMILKEAKDKGLSVRGHTLVWHNQTPAWFFHEDYEEDKPIVDEKTMDQRLESYIKKVITYSQEKYPGVVYAWDVVNEAMGDGGGYRTDKSMWYDIYEERFIEKAFTFARKYADKDVKLFYNDYNAYEPSKRDMIYATAKKLKDKGVIDGIGMQSHWDMEYPSTHMFENALEKYKELGLEIQFTEIDMHNTDDSDEGLKAEAERYKEFFEIIMAHKKNGLNVTNVTFWGLSDDVTWLTGFKGETSYPLLFDEDLQKKPCYDSIRGVINDAG